MKRFTFLFFLTVVLVCSFVNCKEEPKSKVFTISFLKGEAEKSQEPKSLRAYDILPQSEVIRTAKGASLDLASDLGTMRMLGDTVVSLDALTQDALSLTVSEGNILVKAAKLNKGQSLKVVTPTVVAAVRGTQFWGQVNKETETGTFAVRDGAVEITRKSDNVSFTVEKGNALDIDPKNKDWKIRTAKQGELDAMSQIDEIK
ncbi:adhesin Lsa19 [Leptospira ilyithenensis]|uniref:Iron dicitrate transport regulator FecR n=1 Tax=Leptospira ilyithenensis TaxID=2484901 RepID=A0A4R9LM46_9LEPT|nr:FecR domain-containing protein [Leptospira ilyithenensis]TGN07923.1 iron dicitrate transport regulator FecR [Leptospira ilyithenensis]